MHPESSTSRLENPFVRTTMADRSRVFHLMGRKLDPLTIGHAELIYSIDSPLLTGERQITTGELADLAVLLSVPREEFLELYRKGIHRGKIGRRGLFLVRDQAGLDRQLERLEEYLAVWFNPPRIRWKNADKKGELASPFTDYLRCMMARFLGVTPEEARKYPLQDALHHMATVEEIETGETGLETEQDREADKALDALEEMERSGQAKPFRRRSNLPPRPIRIDAR